LYLVVVIISETFTSDGIDLGVETGFVLLIKDAQHGGKRDVR
jgi:predicted RNA-binding protein with TRAM domain